MTNTLKIDFDKKKIIMDKTFAEKVKDTRSDEYIHLQNVRKDYADYTVERRKIKHNPNKQTYPNLTYGFMENYILRHGTDEEVKESLAEYRHLREIAKCQGRGQGYPVIKRWFLNKYTEVRDFGAVA